MSDHFIPPEPPRLMTLVEAAKASRISERTLRLVIAQGRGPATTRLGQGTRGKILVRADMLAAWIDRRTAVAE